MFGRYSHSHKDIDVKMNSYWQYDIGMKDNASLSKKDTSGFGGCGIDKFDVCLVITILESYNTGDFKLDELVSGRYCLEHIKDAFEATKNAGVMRNVIVF